MPPNAPLTKVIRSLRFREDRRAELREIQPDQWPALLKQTDEAQLTLPLGIRCRDDLPDLVRTRIEQNLSSNALRHRLLDIEYRRISEAFRTKSIDYIVLKGPSQIAPLYVSDADYRPQYDIDLYCPPDTVTRARDALETIGFTTLQAGAKYSDHLQPMVRTKDWKWRGDHYAPDLPLTAELHFRFWDEQTEKLSVPCVDDFWRRRCTRVIRGAEVPMLSLTDGISFSALHFMRHLLRGGFRIYHAYEIAHFLHQTREDDEFWNRWRADRAASSPVLEAVAFRLAAAWFGCETHRVVQEQMDHLPARIGRWFDLFSHSPLNLERPNKDELLLHLSLIRNAADRRSVLIRRLAPNTAARQIDPGATAARLRGASFFAARLFHHARTAVNLVSSFCRWKFPGRKYAAS